MTTPLRSDLPSRSELDLLERLRAIGSVLDELSSRATEARDERHARASTRRRCIDEHPGT